MNVYILLLSGLTAGVMSGLVGLAGGFVLIPFLVLGLKMSQHGAQGTYLAAMVLPVTLLGAILYYRRGFVDVRSAGILAVGLALGILAGSHLAQHISDVALKRLFGIVLFLVSIRLIFWR